MKLTSIKYIYRIVGVIICLFLYSVHAVEEGSLSVITDPEGIEVWLGDKYLGDSPIENRKWRTGRYVIKLIDPIQQVSTTEEVFIQKGKTTIIEKSLKRKFGTLKVKSDPEGADVTISASLGKTPLTNNFMNPGKYIIEISHNKKYYEPIFEEITIPQGKTVELTNTLIKKSPFDTKALIRILLGAGAIAGFAWGIYEQGVHKEERVKKFYFEKEPDSKDKMEEADGKSDKAKIRRNCGIAIGVACVIAFEIVAFF
jgi:hypothetical protein